MKKLKKWWKDFRTVTPKEWKKMQKACAGIAGAAGAAWGTIAMLPNVDLNGWDKLFAGIIAFATFVATYAQGMTSEKQAEDGNKA